MNLKAFPSTPSDCNFDNRILWSILSKHSSQSTQRTSTQYHSRDCNNECNLATRTKMEVLFSTILGSMAALGIRNFKSHLLTFSKQLSGILTTTTYMLCREIWLLVALNYYPKESYANFVIYFMFFFCKYTFFLTLSFFFIT